MELELMLYMPEDDENFHIEIYENENNGSSFAEIYKDKDGKLKIEVFGKNDGSWKFDLKYLIDVLKRSFNELNV